MTIHDAVDGKDFPSVDALLQAHDLGSLARIPQYDHVCQEDLRYRAKTALPY